MKENKYAIIIASCLSLFALAVSITLHYFGYDFISNIFSGIFASGILVILVAVINYAVARKKTLEQFYCYALKATNNFNKYENNGNLDETIDSVLSMNAFDYYALDMAVGDICFIFNNKKHLKYIYSKIYNPIRETRELISKKSWHFRLYKKSVNGNTAVMQDFIDEIDSIIMSRTSHEYKTDDKVFKTNSSTNKLVDSLLIELGGHYYDIMYPNKKRKK